VARAAVMKALRKAYLAKRKPTEFEIAQRALAERRAS
jgi:hypothetical protein